MNGHTFLGVHKVLIVLLLRAETTQLQLASLPNK